MPGDFFARPDVIEALAGYDFGAFFKAVRSELRLTQDEFGRLVGLAQSRVCKVENGALHLREIGAVAHLASNLRIPADLLGFTSDPSLSAAGNGQVVDWMQRRDFIATVTAVALGGSIEIGSRRGLAVAASDTPADSVRRVGMSDVERIEATTVAFRDWDNRWGGALCRSAISAQLDWVVSVGKSAVMASEAVRRRLLVATADLASCAAWANYDVEQHREARQLWMTSLDAAREAGNPDLTGSILHQLIHQALHLERPDEAMRLVRLAYAMTADPDHSPSDRAVALSAAYEAWCHAAQGKGGLCDRALAKAEDHFADSRSEEVPPWLAHFDEAELRALHGHALHVLAERVPGAASRAIPLLQDAITQRGPEYARSRTLNLIALASTQLGHPDGAADGLCNGYRALDGVSTLNSPRALSRLRGLDRVAARRAKEPEVAEFRSHLRRVLVNAG